MTNGLQAAWCFVVCQPRFVHLNARMLSVRGPDHRLNKRQYRQVEPAVRSNAGLSSAGRFGVLNTGSNLCLPEGRCLPSGQGYALLAAWACWCAELSTIYDHYSGLHHCDGRGDRRIYHRRRPDCGADPSQRAIDHRRRGAWSDDRHVAQKGAHRSDQRHHPGRQRQPV